MLRWSSESTGRDVDLAAIVNPDAPVGILGGPELVALGRAAVANAVDAAPAGALADVIGDTLAVRAAAVAGAFELYNRIVDGTGLQVSAARRQTHGDIVGILRLETFPHSDR
ncbi:MAG TPA: hypothetical protein VGC11_00345 [Acidimicrobiia bacterium]|jgi:hypothetical protein